MRKAISLLFTLLLVTAAVGVAGWYAWQGLHAPPETPTVQKAMHRQPVETIVPSPTPAATVPVSTTNAVSATVTNQPAASTSVTNTTDAQAAAEADAEAQRVNRLFEQALESVNRGEYNSALQQFKAILPYDKEALTGIGLAYYKLGEYRQAVTKLQQSVDENGAEFKALKLLAMAHYKLDELGKSETYALRALALQDDPDLRRFYWKVRREKGAIKNEVDESNLHFKVVFDGYEHGSISRLILNTLDDAYRDIGQKFDYFPDGTITVVLYTQKEFFDVTRAPSWSGGLFDGKIRIPIKGVDTVDKELLRTVLYHEYVHAMIHDIAQNVPRWVHEGLAEYLVPRGLPRIGQVIPFRSLETAFYSSDSRVAMTAYEESYSIISYLVDRYSIYDIKQFLIAMSHGETTEQAFSDTFIISYDDFARTWGVK